MIDFEKLLTLLASNGVQFVIVGGLAITIHGSSYVTFDLDICYARDDDNLTRLVQALKPINPKLRGAPLGIPFCFDEETVKKGLNFTLTTALGDIDLLGEVTGIGDFPAVAAASMMVELFEHTFSVLTLDALIISKRGHFHCRESFTELR